MAEPGRRRRSSKRSRRKPSLAGQGYRQIERYVRQRLVDAVGREDALPKRLDLRIEVPLRFRGRERELAERQFVAALEKCVNDAISAARLELLGYHEGHVYCYWCSAPVSCGMPSV